ncbi:MAG: flagellar biosynthesis protein [Paenibacillus sp.]|nr:flagellar biosynthesis protein [Paenibacillus sp.]
MISLSKVIKASRVISLDDTVVIKPVPVISVDDSAEFIPGSDNYSERDPHESEAMVLKDQIVSDAEAAAELILAQATEAAELLKSNTQLEINNWWTEKRAADIETAERAKQDGYDSGYQTGYAKAEESVKEQYSQMIVNAKAIIEHATEIKQQMIQEAEPFLIELSCSIAEKIIERQLSLEPEWMIASIRKVLQRKREQGVISLCVSPSQFAFVQDFREELLLAIDSQAELQVLPDPSVGEFGCVVRSSFGSIDARIDTQLEEIKEALLQLFRRGEGTSQNE